MEQIVDLKGGIAEDTLLGLTSRNKYLLPRYFYDDKGSKIFQDIMNMPEYYLTDCEFEIFNTQKSAILEALSESNKPFELVELGSGDGSKTKILLSYFLRQHTNFKYLPIDISAHANEVLKADLQQALPQLVLEPKTGDYFDVLEEIQFADTRLKVILFLGANIGNFSPRESLEFLSKVARFSNVGDKLLIGFDLKKSPSVIMDAYDDPHGHTRNFNLNHLRRLNRELGANFDLNKFEHQTTYSPVTGAVKSFLVSKDNQMVELKKLNIQVRFSQWEPIFMELSQKYNLQDIEKIANESGFKVTRNFIDSRGYFVDSLWEKE